MTKILMLINLLKWVDVLSFLKNLIPQGKRILIYAAILAAVVGAGYYWHKSEINHALEMQAKVLVIQHQQELNNLIAITQAATDELNTRNAENERKRNEEIRRITATHGSIVAGLRDRASRAEQIANSNTSNTSDSGTSSVCTGAELSREDSEFLAGEAARAEQLRSELIYMYQTNKDLREILNGLRSNDAAK